MDVTDPSEQLEPIQTQELSTPPGQEELEGQYPTKPFGGLGIEEGTPESAQGGLSPMDLARQAGTPGTQQPLSPEQLQAQTNQTLKGSEALRQELENRFGDLSDGQKSLLLAKLKKYDGSAGKAASLIGASGMGNEEKAKLAETLKKAGHPSGLAQFMSLITAGDTSLRAVTRQVAEGSGESLNPIQMLKAQYALQSASQSVNFATAVIGQGLNFVKTVMQTQI